VSNPADVHLGIESSAVDSPHYDPELACKDLVVHGVVLFADSWADNQGLDKSEITRQVARQMYAEQLAQSGRLGHLYAMCVKNVSQVQFICAMNSDTTDDFTHCLRP